MPAKCGRQAEREDAEVGDVVAGEAHPVFLVAHRQQERAGLAGLYPAHSRMLAIQQGHAQVVENVLAWVGARVPAEHRLQIGHALTPPV